MKKISLLLSLCLYLLVAVAQPQEPKYVFLMIGDGMGANQVTGTEYFRGALSDSATIKPLLFTQFPCVGLSRTYSHSNKVTDSAAGGTALSVGHKTSNGVLGMDAERTIALTSIAERARDKGRAVGITTSVSIDHATPASFYAHVPNRGMYYQIGEQLAASQFDFFGGADFISPTDGDKPHLHQLLSNAGYTILKGLPAYQKESKKRDKVFLTQAEVFDEKGSPIHRTSLPYAIDRTENDLTLSQITASAIEFLDAKKRGFFLMVEGGAIDWACHSNDASTAFREVEDFDNAVHIAYNFYLQHPDETLIVITADHETGGLAMGTEGYNLYFEQLAEQTCSQPALTDQLNNAINNPEAPFTWEAVQQILKESLGFWREIQLTNEQEILLKEAYQKTAEGKAQKVESEYFRDDFIAVTAIRILNQNAHSGWTTGSHSGALVPIYAIGVGAERFIGVMENTEIPRRIAKIANY